MNKVKTSYTTTTKRPTIKQDNIKPAPIPLTYAWATLTVHEVEKRTFQGQDQLHKPQPEVLNN